ncbi:MAG: hypothetical protein GYA24_15675 [Candidatus Lokiarchaeota archaeon]|nr:hypothetical protein [Candidatus Lokiarchaeota archaeon]
MGKKKGSGGLSTEIPSSTDNSGESFDLDKQYPEFLGWESIGFHRGLGREFWQIIIELIGTATNVFIIAILVPLLEPFPEIRGYQTVAGGVFALVYTIFDIGTNFGLNRFIAEFRVKNVRKMLQYASFCIWYQSFTGLAQVTILSWMTFQVVVHSQFAYITWILLLGLQKQYPGWLGIMRQILEGMQHYSKVEIIGFLQGQIVERVTTIGFVLAFRYYGETHVGLGFLMGIIIGNVIGSYVDDIAFELVAGYYLHKILKKYFGLSLRDIFRVKYDRDVLRDIIFYSLQGSILPVIGSFAGTFGFFTYVGNINAYTTWNAIIGRGISFAGQIRQFGDFALQNSIAEAYPNGKKKLAEFYFSSSVKWRYMFMIMLAFIIIAIFPFFVVLINELRALQYYKGAELFILPGVMVRLLWPFVEMPDAIMWGTKRITQINIIRIGEEFAKIFFVWLFVIVMRVQETWGMFGLFFLIGLNNWVPTWIKTIVCYIYINKKVMRLKVYWRSTIVIPVIASLPNIGMAQLWYNVFFFPIKAVIGLEFTLALSIVLLFIVVIFTYFPLVAALGGLDDYQLFTFRKAVTLAGPSKPLFKAVEWLVLKGVGLAKRLGWHARFPIPYEEAHQEIKELMEIKRQALQANKEGKD